MFLCYYFIMRIDKFLKVSRILKRRTTANEACGNGRVAVNGKEVKPSYQLKIDDVVEIKFSSNPLCFKVLKLAEYAKKDDADTMYEILA